MNFFAAVASGVAAGVQGIFSEAAGIQAANASPVMDKRFTQYEYLSIHDFETS